MDIPDDNVCDISGVEASGAWLWTVALAALTGIAEVLEHNILLHQTLLKSRTIFPYICDTAVTGFAATDPQWAFCARFRSPGTTFCPLVAI